MRRICIGVLFALTLASTAGAHRLDEYLQATLIGVSRDRVDVEIRLTPGVAILPVLMPVIDRDRDGRISAQEEQAYVERVVRDVELRLDGAPAPLSLIESSFPTLESMREGLGAIVIKLRSVRTGRRLRFENRHLPQFSVYLVNCLASPSGGLAVGPPRRDEAQRSIQFDYSFASAPLPALFWPAALGVLLLGRMAFLLYRSKYAPAIPGCAGSPLPAIRHAPPECPRSSV